MDALFFNPDPLTVMSRSLPEHNITDVLDAITSRRYPAFYAALRKYQHLFSPEPRQHQIQKHQIRLSRLQHKKRFRSGIGAGYLITLSLKRLLQHISNMDIIIYHKYVFHPVWSPVFPRQFFHIPL